ncbi:MAG: peroxiredoxin [Myxococcota bacterium]
MTIKVGDKLPSQDLKRMGDAGLEDVSTDSIFSGRKVVLFSVPGAFTPTCHKEHLPSYVENAAQIKGKGVDEIVCLSVNDPFVMKAWGDAVGATGKVTMLPDWDASFSKALGLTMDAGGAGLGVRGQRFSMVVEDGVVKSLDVEENSGKMVVSDAATCLTHLG